MKRWMALAATVCVLGAGEAIADTIQNAIGNTLVVTTSSGATVRYHFNADGTYAAMLPDGATANGAWEIFGDQICLTPAGGARGCTGYVADKNVGDSWSQTGVDGDAINVEIVAGQ